MTIQIGSYESTIKAEAKARRIRLMGVTEPVRYKSKPQVTWVRPYCRAILDEDAHVRAWRWYQANKTEVDKIMSRSGDEFEFLLTPERESMRSICLRVIEATGGNVTLAEIIGDRRQVVITDVRQKCYYEIKKIRGDLSYPQIAKFMRKDHSSLVTGVRKLTAAGWTGI